MSSLDTLQKPDKDNLTPFNQTDDLLRLILEELKLLNGNIALITDEENPPRVS